jgi:hypothetical protein
MDRTAVLEGRKFTVEDRMFAVAARLAESLHALEHEAAALHKVTHELVCERGRMPIEIKTAEIVDRVGRAIVAMDLNEVRTLQRQVASLKQEIDGYERELADIREARREGLVTTAA